MDISAGIVTFNPNIGLLYKNIVSIMNQCRKIYLVDNGSDNIVNIEHLLKQIGSSKTILIYNNENRGIACALNQVCEKAQEDGFEWIITLDQDSIASQNMVNEYSLYIEDKTIALLAPVLSNKKGKYGKHILTTQKPIELNRCITSGSMINISIWDSLGRFDEKLFIDNVDFDMCCRIKENGFRILCIPTVSLLHEIGSPVEKRFLLRRFYVYNHPAFRKYYIARNTVYLARKKKKKYLLLKVFLQIVKLVALVLFYEQDKTDKIESIFRGFKDGLRMEL